MIKHFLAPIIHEDWYYKWYLPVDKPKTLTISAVDIHHENLTCIIKVDGPAEDIAKIECDELQEVEV